MWIKEIMPWRMKIILKIILSRIPLSYKFWQKIGLFRHGKMLQAKYVESNFNEYCTIAKLSHQDLKGKTILELGPGDSIGTALVASSYGLKTILIDVGNYAVEDVSVYQLLANELRSKGINVPNIDSVRSFDEILNICNAQYLSNGLDSFYSLKDNSVDIIVSQAVLEHVRKDDFPSIIHECQRVMKESGVSVHSIDLKDHLDKALNNLRFNNNFWESSFISSSGFYTNRIRYSGMLEIFKHAHFSVEVVSINRWEKLPTPRQSLSDQFYALSDDNLLVSEFTVLLKHTDGKSRSNARLKL